MTRRRLALSALVLGAGAAWLGQLCGLWRPSRPDPSRFAVWGLDVSHHQGKIDWQAVATEPHVVFAYIKATEGGDWADPRFVENWHFARRAGIQTGAYHFYTFCRPPADQARHFLSIVPPEPDMLPPAVDVEFEGNCAAVPDRDALVRDLSLWSAAVGEALGRRPVVYTTEDAYDAFFAGGPPQGPLWIRGVASAPALPDGAAWSFWQFDDAARVRGVGGPVDMSLFRGDLDVLRRFAAPEGAR